MLYYLTGQDDAALCFRVSMTTQTLCPTSKCLSISLLGIHSIWVNGLRSFGDELGESLPSTVMVFQGTSCLRPSVSFRKWIPDLKTGTCPETGQRVVSFYESGCLQLLNHLFFIFWSYGLDSIFSDCIYLERPSSVNHFINSRSSGGCHVTLAGHYDTVPPWRLNTSTVLCYFGIPFG